MALCRLLPENQRCKQHPLPQVNGLFPLFSLKCLTLAVWFSTLADMSKRIALGAAIKAIREAKAQLEPEKFSGSRFATTCLMSPAHLCNIEAGRKCPPEEVVHRIAAHLGVPVNAISYVDNQTSMEAIAS
jgi:hypothetical protein